MLLSIFCRDENCKTLQYFMKDKSKISIFLGLDEKGNPFIKDLTKTGNIIISQDCGCGATNLIENLVVCLSKKYDSDYLQFAIVDTICDLKKMEKLRNFSYFTRYLTKKTIKFFLKEITKREKTLKRNDCSNIEEYNQKVNDKMPYLVLFINDEFCELPIDYEEELEKLILSINDISQKCGIYIIAKFDTPKYISKVIANKFKTQLAFNLKNRKTAAWTKYNQCEVNDLSVGNMIYVDGEIKKELSVIFYPDQFYLSRTD